MVSITGGCCLHLKKTAFFCKKYMTWNGEHNRWMLFASEEDSVFCKKCMTWDGEHNRWMLFASEEDKSIFVVGLIAVVTQEENNIDAYQRLRSSEQS
jgi:hypothetical protein